MATVTIHDACDRIGTQLGSMTAPPEVWDVVPKDYGNVQPASARNFWVILEQVKESIEAETSTSFLQHFTIGVWVWVASSAKLNDAAGTVATKVAAVRDKLIYNSLGGWARTGIANDDFSEIKYVKGGNATNARYGANFFVTVTKQSTP